VNKHTFTKQAKKFHKARNLMATVFWDKIRVLLVEFMQQDTTITSEVYCETLKNFVGPFRKKRRGMLTSSVVLHHEYLRPPTVARIRTLLDHFNWELFDPPPYSPDLAPSAYYLFTYLKNWMRSQRFNNNEELMEGVKTRLNSQAADFFDTGKQELTPRYDKCLSLGGDYVEK
jgi:histone-lysine N-methyltransferase SETMAR